MDTPTSEPNPKLAGLSEAQLQLLDRLHAAGSSGMHMTEFFKTATEIGVEPNSFAELVKKNLLVTKPGNLYVHPNFVE